MIEAARQRNSAITDLLLKYGADVNAKDQNGNTALLVAAEHANVETITSLLKAGADVYAKDKEGHDVLWHLNQSSHSAQTKKQQITDLLEKAMKK